MLAWSIARFELRKRLGMLSSYVYFVALFAAAFLIMISAAGAFSGISVSSGSDKVFANAPFQVGVFLTILGNFGVLVTAAVFGQAVHQDFESHSDALFFTTPVPKQSYLAGRFAGALLFSLLVFASLPLGFWVGTKMPFIDHSLIEANRASTYFWPYLVMLVPNLLFTGALFFALATLLRTMKPVYVGTVVLVIGYLLAGNLIHKIENKPIAALVDPFGMNTWSIVTDYWTVADKNSLLIPFHGLLLANRLIWLGLGAALLGYTFYKFRFAAHGTREGSVAQPETVTKAEGVIPVVATTEAHPLWLLAHSTWLAFKETVKNVYFGVIVLAGVLFMVVTAWQSTAWYGTPTYPVTHSVLELTGGFGIFVLIIITFYAGELVWRERDAGIDQILDALPTRTWLPFVSKLLALVLVQVVLSAVVLVTGVAIQTTRGYFHYELGLYVKELFGLRLIDGALLCVLAITVQTLVQNKYLGHFIMVLYYLWTLFMGRLGLEHNLYKFGEAPSYQYSDMNKFGHFLKGVFWFDAYWGAFAVLLAILSSLFWMRGRETGFAVRSKIANARFARPLRLASALFLVAFVAMGGFIFYNTNILNQYKTKHDDEREHADYEKAYKKLAKEPQPRITDVKVSFDIFPEKHALIARGHYRIRNKTSQPIQTIYLNVPTDNAKIRNLAIGTAKAQKKDDRLGFYTFDLGGAPLAPGATSAIDFEIAFQQHGFANNEQRNDIVENGTFFSSQNLPSIGYNEYSELTEDSARKKYGLSPKERMHDLDDLDARKNNCLAPDADWVTFEATVSTSPDQIAITPGYLQKEWVDNGRRYFEYKMDSKILNFFSVLSARYEVKRDHWNDVALEIYYHPGHQYDLDEMMKGMKAALDYYTAAFGPYQHRQVRILEYPRYHQFAQSFPNTIPYSEAIGFIAKVDPKDEEDVHFPFYVTAHEVAHQWWGHQVVPGNVQGCALLAESMSQYSALMVMKNEFGASHMKRFLKYELDKYLSERGFERKKEMPLVRVETQPYIYYRKGSLAMYALEDYVGEAAVNQALSSYLNATKFQEPPYTNSTELLGYFRKVVPDDLKYIIEDLFETITLYDNRALSASARKVADGQYEVTVKLAAKKVRADGLGAEHEVAMDDLVDIGAVDDKGEPIVLEKRRLHAGESEFKVFASKLPAKAGIDPLNKLIDRKPDDNLARVKVN